MTEQNGSIKCSKLAPNTANTYKKIAENNNYEFNMIYSYNI